MLDTLSLARWALLPLFLLLPGMTLFASLPASRDPDAQASSLVEGVWRVVIASIVLTGWAGILLAELGLFSLPALTVLVAVISLVPPLVVWMRGRKKEEGRRKEDRGHSLYSSSTLPFSFFLFQSLIPLALFIFALVLFARPHETVLGGADAGVYLNSGAYIARSGGYLVREPLLADLEPEDRAMFLQVIPETPGIPLRFPGFYTTDIAQGVTQPQFFPLFPIWLAITDSIGGVWASLWIVPLFGALGVLSVYFAGRFTLGTLPAAVGALILTLSAPQVWFSRYTTAEALTQPLLWTTVFAFSAYIVTGFSPRLGWLAALALGGVLFTRIDTPFLLALPGGLVLWAIYKRDWRRVIRDYGAFLIPVTLLTAHNLVHAYFFAYPYVRSTARIFPILLPLLGGITFGLLVAFALFLLFVRLRRASDVSRITYHTSSGTDLRSLILTHQSFLRRALALGIVALAIFAYFVRPLIGQAVPSNTWYTGSVVASPHLSLIQLGWYLSPLGILLSVVGAALIAYDGNLRRDWLTLAVGLFFSLIYLTNPFNNPSHIYMMRRYVPAIIPAFTLYAGYALAWVAGYAGGQEDRKTGRQEDRKEREAEEERRAGGQEGRRAGVIGRWVVAGALGVGVVYGMLPTTRAVLGGSELAGAVDQVRALAGRFEPNALLVFRDPVPVGTGATIGSPLQFYYGVQSLVLQDGFAPQRLTRVLETWRSTGRPVYLILGDGATLPPEVNLPLAPVERALFDLRALEASFYAAPTRWVDYRPGMTVYRVADSAASGRVDVGGLDALAVVGGLYDAEDTGKETFRWTNGNATLRASRPTNATSLRLRLGAPSPTQVQVLLNDMPLGQIDAQAGFAEYRLPLPLGAAGQTLIRLTSPTMVPGGADTRQLGVTVDWLVIE